MKIMHKIITFLSLLFLSNFVLCSTSVKSVDLAFLNNHILSEDFVKQEEKNLALILSAQLESKKAEVAGNNKFEKQTAILNCLVEKQKSAHAKLQILLAAKESGLTERAAQSIRLNVLNELYSIIRKNWKKVLDGKVSLEELNNKILSDDFLIKLVKNLLPPQRIGIRKKIKKKIQSLLFTDELQSLLKTDIHTLWPNLYQSYEDVVIEYANSKKEIFINTKMENLILSELDKTLVNLEKQKDILLNIDFTCGSKKILKRLLSKLWLVGKVDKLQVERIEDEAFGLEKGYFDAYRRKIEEQLKNSIKIFDIFIFRLIEIKSEIEKNRNFVKEFSALEPAKQTIVSRHAVLTENKDFAFFGSESELADSFVQYQMLVKEYLKNEQQDKTKQDQFKSKLLKTIISIESLKYNAGASGIWLALGDKQADELLRILNEMLSILKEIARNTTGVDLLNEPKNKKGLIERFLSEQADRVLNGEIEIPDKVLDLFWRLIQKRLG